MSVYKAINAVQAELSKIGITKDGQNTQGKGYRFRGIDQVYNTLSPLLSKHGLCILPRVIKSEQTERKSANGNNLIYSYVTMEFDLVYAEDGSKHTVCTVGEAFDSGDKSMNKAMSAAYKYAAFQAFAIPTEGDNDADAHTYEVAPKHVARVTDSQAADIIALVTELGADKAAMLAWVSDKAGEDISTVSAIPAEAYESIMKMLERKRAP